MSNLSSKKAVLIALVVLVIAIWFFWYVGKQQQGASYELVYQNPKLKETLENRAAFDAFIAEKIITTGGELASASDFTPQASYQLADLQIGADNSAGAAKTYGLAVAEALKPLTVAHENEFTLTFAILNHQDPIAIKALSDIKTSYAQASVNLIAIKIPPNLATIHLSIINSAANIATLLAHMQNGANQPLIALQAAETYLDYRPTFFNNLATLNQYFTKHGISFTPAERIDIYVAPTEE